MLGRLLRRPLQLLRMQQAKSVLPRLTAHKHPKLKAIGEALHEAITETVPAQEQKLVDDIENRRSVLLNSDKKIAVVDYGVDAPGSTRTREEMRKGVPSTRLVASLCKASMSQFWSVILFKLIRKLEPMSCVELGSCVGISASYQAAALKLNGKGRLLTLEGSPETADIARETLKSLTHLHATVITGPFHETLVGALASAKPIDFFLNDGHHDHDAVIQYFNEALPNLAPEAVIVFDDISWSPGMRKAWSEIEDDPRVAASIDLQRIGIVVTGNKPAAKEKFRIPQ
jgi:predicted O-methyltransferase YrrM